MVVVLTDIMGWYDTYDDINGFVQVDNNAILIDDRNCRNTSFGKHVHNVEHCGVHGCSGYGMERIVAFRTFSLWDMSAR